MNKLKAVVLEKNNAYCTVLTKEGSFRTIKWNKDVQVGEEIEIPVKARVSDYRRWVAVAAVFLLVLTSVLSWNVFRASAAMTLLSVDINPSLELSLDSHSRIVKATSLNQDAQKLITGLNLQGKKAEEALPDLINAAVRQKFITTQHNWVVIGVSPLNDSRQVLSAQPEPQDIANWLLNSAGKEGIVPQVVVFQVSAQDSKTAQNQGLTLGEYALWQAAQQAGVHVQPQALKNSEERMKLLNQLPIQAQIKKGKNVLQVPPQNPGQPSTTSVIPSKQDNTGSARDNEVHDSQQNARLNQGESPFTAPKERNAQMNQNAPSARENNESAKMGEDNGNEPNRQNNQGSPKTVTQPDNNTHDEDSQNKGDLEKRSHGSADSLDDMGK